MDETGQGAGWSPPIWTLVSDILITALTEDYTGMIILALNGSSFNLRHLEMHIDGLFQNFNEMGVKYHNQKTEKDR